MSYYYKGEYKFSDHGLVRIKDRLDLKKMSDQEAINYCLKLINLSHDVSETKSFKYIKVNGKQLYFIVKKPDNLIITLSPIKPEKLLAILDADA